MSDTYTGEKIDLFECSIDYGKACVKIKPESKALINGKSINAIKAEGIREAAEKFKSENACDDDGYLMAEEQYAYDFMINYANKLEEGE